MSRTSTQHNEVLSGAAGRKPTAAVRISRRVRGARFGKWLTKRLRRVRHRPRRQKQPAFTGQELTEKNVRRIKNVDRVVGGKLRKRNYKKQKGNTEMVKVKLADLLKMSADMEKENKDADMGKKENSPPVVDMDGVAEQDGKKYGDIIMLPNGRVISPGKKPTPAVVKHDTIGRRAAAWFKEQTGSVRDSVDLTRFLLREMKSEMMAPL